MPIRDGSDKRSKSKLQAGGLVLARQAKDVLESPAWRQDTEHMRISVIIPVRHPVHALLACMPDGPCTCHHCSA
jgi:hypothetical protein